MDRKRDLKLKYFYNTDGDFCLSLSREKELNLSNFLCWFWLGWNIIWNCPEQRVGNMEMFLFLISRT